MTLARLRDYLPERDAVAPAVLGLILAASFTLTLINLHHRALRPLDESFHALVAQNLLERPFTPLLIAEPYLPYDYRDWQNNHVWLHKGIVPLWQIAVSYLVFGENTFALRFPSALLGTLSVLLTYLIGRELLDRPAALVAAALQAFCPAIFMLMHGYAFSDHVDIALLFWTLLGLWLVVRVMKTGSLPLALLAGAAQGVAFLSKMYPALIVGAVAIAVWMLPRLKLTAADAVKLCGKRLGALWLATLVTAAPWLIACAIRFPDEFRHEYLFALQHLTHDIEQWGAPWDRLVFGYLLAALYVFYPAIVAAAVLLPLRAWHQKDAGLWVVLVWGFGVLIPFTIAVTKTPSATLVGWPALFLMFGAMVSRAVGGDRLMLGAWLAAAVLGVVARGEFDVKGMGGQPGEILRQNLWALWHILGAAACGIALWLLPLRFPRGLIAPLVIFAAVASAWLFAIWGHTAWRVTQMNVNEPNLIEIGRVIDQKLPQNAVLLIEERLKHERSTLMFRSRRTAYPLNGDRWKEHALMIVDNGGIPLVVSHRDLPLRPLFRSERDGRTLYQLTPADLGLAEPPAPARGADESVP